MFTTKYLIQSRGQTKYCSCICQEVRQSSPALCRRQARHAIIIAIAPWIRLLARQPLEIIFDKTSTSCCISSTLPPAPQPTDSPFIATTRLSRVQFPNPLIPSRQLVPSPHRAPQVPTRSLRSDDVDNRNKEALQRRNKSLRIVQAPDHVIRTGIQDDAING